MSIPVFHDDQHGTAIISGAALLNGVALAGKQLADMRIVVSGAGASAIACAEFYVSLGVPAAAHHAGGLGGRGLRGPRPGHEHLQGALRAPGRRRPHARRRRPRRRRVPGAVQGGAVHARDAEDDGRKAAGLRAGEPRPRDQLPRRAAGAPRRHHRDRALGLPQPGQQRARLPVRVPRRARRARPGHQRGDEDRRRARPGRAGARAGARQRRRGLRREVVPLRPRVPHPQALRHARAVVVRARRRRGGDGLGRGAPPRRSRRVPGAAAAAASAAPSRR